MSKEIARWRKQRFEEVTVLVKPSPPRSFDRDFLRIDYNSVLGTFRPSFQFVLEAAYQFLILHFRLLPKYLQSHWLCLRDVGQGSFSFHCRALSSLGPRKHTCVRASSQDASRGDRSLRVSAERSCRTRGHISCRGSRAEEVNLILGVGDYDVAPRHRELGSVMRRKAERSCGRVQGPRAAVIPCHIRVCNGFCHERHATRYSTVTPPSL